MDAFQIIVSVLFFFVTSGMMFTLRKIWGRVDQNSSDIQDVKNNYLDRFEKLTATVGSLEIKVIDRIAEVKDKLTDTKLFSNIIKETTKSVLEAFMMVLDKKERG